MTNEEFILRHRTDNVRRLALASFPDGVDAKWCLQQIEGWQLACEKLKQWSRTPNIWFPPRISMEQCSGEATADYKQQVVSQLIPQADRRKAVTDLTGGYGIDFSFLAPLFQQAHYVEQQPHLCDIATHNMQALNISHTHIHCCDSVSYLDTLDKNSVSLLYLDPSRRDGAGKKTVALEDCMPDVTQLVDKLLYVSRFVMLKLSPMLDITQAMRALHHVVQIHTLTVRGECKELLMVLDRETHDKAPTFYSVNLPDGKPFSCSADERTRSAATGQLQQGIYLHEPCAGLLKSGCQDAFALRYGMRKLHPMSNLFVTEQHCPEAADSVRTFIVDDWGDFSKASVKRLLADVRQANLTVRNFPASVAELRKRLKLKEGGSIYLFATTLSDGSHQLIRCHKPE